MNSHLAELKIPIWLICWGEITDIANFLAAVALHYIDTMFKEKKKKLLARSGVGDVERRLIIW